MRETVTVEAKPRSRRLPDAAALFCDNAAGDIPHLPPKAAAKSRKGRAAVAGRAKRLYVLDTNVLMHDPMSLYAFEEHDVFLPMTVLEELDGHKVGTSEVARNARAVTRAIDLLIDADHGGLLSQGVVLAADGHTEARGRLYFETEPMGAALPEAMARNKGDNHILSVVKGLAGHFPQHDAVLVTKDINMRIKAAALGLPAEDYFSDKVIDDSDLLDAGQRRLAPDFWERVGETLQVEADGETALYRFKTSTPGAFYPNLCVWTDTPEPFEGRVTAVEGDTITLRATMNRRQASVFGIAARNREQNFALDLLLDPDIDFVTLIGQAGTGKTLLSLAAALHMTVDEHRFDEIVVTRATVSVGEEIGYLPGTEEEKMLPWMGAITDNLEVLTGSAGQKKWQKDATADLLSKYISMKSISFMRGRTFQRKFVLIDEAQNLTPKEIKTLITRAGPGTKIVCLGNLSQIDTPYLTEGSSGLTYAVERFLPWAHAGTLTLSRGERSRLSEYAAEHF